MRLDHLLSKDWLCGVASWSCVVWIVEWVWAGWGSALAEGLGGRLCLVGLFSRVVGLSGAGMRDTPAAALLGGGGCPRVLVCVWGWHAVGVLGQCALVAWPAFSASLFVGGVGVGVGGLVVNCIVDASILL